jgi:hypothetical protein
MTWLQNLTTRLEALERLAVARGEPVMRPAPGEGEGDR